MRGRRARRCGEDGRAAGPPPEAGRRIARRRWGPGGTEDDHDRSSQTGSGRGSTIAAARAEAEERAHDRVAPDAMLDSIAAVNIYVEAFVAGAKFAAACRGNGT